MALDSQSYLIFCKGGLRVCCSDGLKDEESIVCGHGVIINEFKLTGFGDILNLFYGSQPCAEVFLLNLLLKCGVAGLKRLVPIAVGAVGDEVPAGFQQLANAAHERWSSLPFCDMDDVDGENDFKTGRSKSGFPSGADEIGLKWRSHVDAMTTLNRFAKQIKVFGSFRGLPKSPWLLASKILAMVAVATP